MHASATMQAPRHLTSIMETVTHIVVEVNISRSGNNSGATADKLMHL